MITAVVAAGGDPSAVTALHPVIVDVDERRPVELLWAEQDALERADQNEPDESRFAGGGGQPSAPPGGGNGGGGQVSTAPGGGQPSAPPGNA